ncbi:flavin reductase [Shewanella olleyana]|uniref:flavin reductase family protein n=1 Tax=Shewanella olleyana TaxID=135626 RepID=UPI00200BC71C|nr:flavin reductase [Shewanella olleyana]MCL1065792.1 flavin reductase [Shewanella olleyana]
MILKQFSTADFSAFEQRYRAHFINSLSGFKSANLIGSQDENGITNLSMVSSVFHLGASPALMGMIIRPDTVPRDTLSNIKQTGVYTINHVSSDIYQQAHQTSARYDAEVSEFDEVGLTPQYLEGISAPFVGESLLKMSLAVREITPIKLNSTILVIGEITQVLVPETIINSDGFIDIEAIDSVAVSGLDSYHSTGRLSRLAYAKAKSKA